MKKLILKKHDRFTQIVVDEEVNTNKDPRFDQIESTKYDVRIENEIGEEIQKFMKLAKKQIQLKTKIRY